jgi:hypothetical protein
MYDTKELMFCLSRDGIDVDNELTEEGAIIRRWNSIEHIEAMTKVKRNILNGTEIVPRSNIAESLIGFKGLIMSMVVL